VPLLRERGEQADLLVCDVNCSPSEVPLSLSIIPVRLYIILESFYYAW